MISKVTRLPFQIPPNVAVGRIDAINCASYVMDLDEYLPVGTVLNTPRQLYRYKTTEYCGPEWVKERHFVSTGSWSEGAPLFPISVKIFGPKEEDVHPLIYRKGISGLRQALGGRESHTLVVPVLGMQQLICEMSEINEYLAAFLHEQLFPEVKFPGNLIHNDCLDAVINTTDRPFLLREVIDTYEHHAPDELLDVFLYRQLEYFFPKFGAMQDPDPITLHLGNRDFTTSRYLWKMLAPDAEQTTAPKLDLSHCTQVEYNPIIDRTLHPVYDILQNCPYTEVKFVYILQKSEPDSVGCWKIATDSCVTFNEHTGKRAEDKGLALARELFVYINDLCSDKHLKVEVIYQNDEAAIFFYQEDRVDAQYFDMTLLAATSQVLAHL